MRKDRVHRGEKDRMSAALGRMEGQGHRGEQETFSALPLHARREGGRGQTHPGVLGGPAVQAGQGERRTSRQLRPGREDGKSPGWGSTRLTCTGLSDCGRRGSARRVSQAPARPRPADDGQSAAAGGGTDTHPGDPEAQTGWREGRDSNALLKQGQQPPEAGQTSLALLLLGCDCGLSKLWVLPRSAGSVVILSIG